MPFPHKRNRHLNRKEERKNKRLEKKQKKFDYFNRKQTNGSTVLDTKPQTSQEIKVKDLKNIDSSLTKKQNDHLAKDQVIQEKPKKVHATKNAKRSLSDDDLDFLEEKLKIKKGQQLPSSFKKDGLDYILGGLIDGFSDSDSNSEGIEELGEYTSSDEKSDNELLSYSNEESLNSNTDEDEAKVVENNEVDMNSYDDKLSYQYSSESHDGDDSDGDSFTNESEDLRDIPVKMDCEDAKNTQTNHLPPSKRYATENSQLQKSVQGLLNRLSETNIEPIFNQFQSLFLQNPRKLICDAYCQSLSSFLNGKSSVLESFLYSASCLTSIFYHVYGSDFSGQIIENIWKDFLYYLNSYSTDDEIINKATVNCCTFLCYLYLFANISSSFMFSLLKYILTSKGSNEIHLEILIKMLKLTGYNLKKEDQESYKEILILIPSFRPTCSIEKQSRIDFMLGLLLDLNSNRSSLVKAHDKASSVNILKKFINSLLQKHHATQNEPFQITVEDLNDVEKKGKWWVIGGVWKQPEDFLQTKLASSTGAEKCTDSLIQQAISTNHMNTSVRKNIFEALMRADDHLDAVYRIALLKLKGSQEREIARILVYCLGKEKSYNPFYAMVAKDLCTGSYSHSVTFRYILWDFFNEILKEKLTSTSMIENYAKFFAFLFQKGILSLSSLKGAKLIDLKKKSILFLQCLLTTFAYELQPESDFKVHSVQLSSNVELLEMLIVIVDNYIINPEKNPYFSIEVATNLNLLRKYLVACRN